MYPLQALPQPPFTWNIVGPTGCGKTYMFTHVLKEYIKHGVFREQDIHLFCPTLFQKTYEQFPNIHKYKVFSPDIVVSLHKASDNIRVKYGEDKVPNILIIYDDCFSSGSGGNNAMRSNIAVEMSTHGRHYNINQAMLTQHLNGLQKAIRENGAYMSMFRPRVMGAAQDFFTQMIEKDMREIVWKASKRVWAKKFAFVHLLFDEMGDQKYRDGFTKLLLTDDNLNFDSENSSSSEESDSASEICDQLEEKRNGIK